MNIRDFEHLFAYDAWAMDRLLAAWRKAPPGSLDMPAFLADCLAKDRVWLACLTGTPVQDSGNPADAGGWIHALDAMQARFAAFIAGLSPLEMGRTVSIHEGSRLPFHLSMPMALTHVMFRHAARRDKLACLLQDVAVDVPPVDFLAFARDRGGKSF